MRGYRKTILCVGLTSIALAVAPFFGAAFLSPFGLTEMDTKILGALRLPRVLLCVLRRLPEPRQ